MKTQVEIVNDDGEFVKKREIVFSSVDRWIRGKNLSDKRIHRRLELIIGFLYGEFKMLQKGLIRELSQDYLTDQHHFGTGKDYRLLKEILLIPVSRHVVGECATTYALVRHEFLALLEYTGINAELARENYLRTRIAYLTNEHLSELESGEFDYRPNKNPLSFRRYHPLTNEMRDVRDSVLSSGGFRFQYDIKSCFPTLIYQQWVQNYGEEAASIELPQLKRLVENPDLVRSDLMYLLGIRQSVAKGILSALLFGAPCRGKPNDEYAIYKLLDSNEFVWNKLVECKWLQALIVEFKLMKAELPPIAIETLIELKDHCAGATVIKRFYFSCELLEYIVITFMTNYILAKGGKTFRIHDCVSTNLDLDVEELITYVEKQSNFRVKLSKKEYE